MIKRIYTICCVLIVIIGLNRFAYAQEVFIPDPNLASAIRKVFSLPQNEPITQQLMQELTKLTAQRANISDLTGLEHAKNLTTLNLYGNQIKDISTLATLTNLQVLSLRSNQISDISPLAEMTQLETLFLESNEIMDITPLMKLTQVKYLSLLSNQIKDISPLADMTELETLSLAFNEISDLTPLAGMTSLADLYLNDNEISDLKPLAGLTQLETLWIGANQISNLVPLRTLTQLGELYLEFNQIRIVTPLKELSQLEILSLESNQIRSIALLKALSNLETLYIKDNPISNISQIHELIAAGVEVDFDTPVPHESQVALTRVLFNEVRNAADDRNDWIELRNISNTDLPLSEWEISILTRDRGTISDEVDVVSFPDYTLPAGGILLITNTDPRQTTLLRGQNIKTPDIRRGAQHHYLIADKLNLPNTQYMLILRSAQDRNGTQESIEDVAGTYFLDTLTADQPLTQGTAWERSTISEVGYNAEAWEASGYKGGIGYQPAALKETSPGTPGYPNNLLVRQQYTGQISISEVMFTNKIGNRTVPQWIELYNNSPTEPVDLTRWNITYEYREGRQNKSDEKAFQNLVVLPKQTVVIVSETSASTQNIPDRRVYDLFAVRFGDIEFSTKGNSFLASDGFFLRLSTPNGATIDTVGNLDGDSDTQDTPLWELPSGTTENGARSSMLRLYHHETRIPLAGTEASSWRRAVDVKLGKSTYYGDRTDVGNPGYTLGGILPVTLSHFRAELTNAGVILSWTTESEVDNAGFYIYRSETKDGEFKVVNLTMIQGADTTGERNEYTWTDTTAKQNIAYYYRIEDVSHAGVRNQLATVRCQGIVSASGKFTVKWADLKIQPTLRSYGSGK